METCGSGKARSLTALWHLLTLHYLSSSKRMSYNEDSLGEEQYQPLYCFMPRAFNAQWRQDEHIAGEGISAEFCCQPSHPWNVR